jgi:hypothetical protein
MALFGRRIAIFTKDGKNCMKQDTGRQFTWDFSEEVRRIRGVIPGLLIPVGQFTEIIATTLDLDRKDRTDKLIQMTLKKE